MTATDPSFVLDLIFGFLPVLVGLLGLCLVGWLPRPRGTAVSGLILFTLGPLVGVFLYGALSGTLISAGLLDVMITLSFLGTLLLATGLLLLAVAATRGTRGPENEHGPGWDRGGIPHQHRPYGGA